MEAAAYLELIELASDAVGSHAMNVVTVLISYLVAVWLVGKKLTNLQVTLLTVIYSIFYFFPSFGTYQTFDRGLSYAREFFIEHPEVAPRHIDLSAEGAQYVLVVLFSLGWFVSVLFMISIRRQDEDT